MDIRIQITDNDNEIKYKVERILNTQLEQIVKEKLLTIDIDKLIIDKVNSLVDRSKYVSDDIIRNLVQQKIARELTDKILNK